MQAEIARSYNQLCVFDPLLDKPYNDWNVAQTEQGFSWRPGSVSFRTDDGISSAKIVVEQSQEAPGVQGASTVIRVPFDVPSSGLIEVGSILSGVSVRIPAGSYALYFSHPLETRLPFTLSFVLSDEVEPAVLKASELAKVQDAYDMQACAA